MACKKGGEVGCRECWVEWIVEKKREAKRKMEGYEKGLKRIRVSFIPDTLRRCPICVDCVCRLRELRWHVKREEKWGVGSVGLNGLWRRKERQRGRWKGMRRG